jgi:hypothetical protein
LAHAWAKYICSLKKERRILRASWRGLVLCLSYSGILIFLYFMLVGMMALLAIGQRMTVILKKKSQFMAVGLAECQYQQTVHV